MKKRISLTFCKSLVSTLLIAVSVSPALRAQSRLKTMPGYDQYQNMSKEIPGSVKMGTLTVKWQDDGKSFDYYKDGKTFRYDIAARAANEAGPAPADAENGRMGGRRRAGGPERGRQYSSAESPDKKLKAFCRDRNLWLSDPSGVRCLVCRACS